MLPPLPSIAPFPKDFSIYRIPAQNFPERNAFDRL